MNVPSSTERVQAAVAALGVAALSEASVARHVAPLFTRVLARNRERIYLANHSLGRPLDALEDDVAEALSAWYTKLPDAWDAWATELAAYRGRLARLMGAPRDDCVIPKTSAGAGLRAVLNTSERRARVVATRGEFDSLDVILREYAQRGRIELALVEPDEDERFDEDAVERATVAGTDLVVLSHAMFRTGQLLQPERVVARAHAVGATVLLDVYHSLGVVPVDLAAMNCDFAVGGSYKYLRGGPGACFLYVAPRCLDARLRTLDIGWFAKEVPFGYARPDPPRFAAGGDGWMESTPPVLTWYQARSGQVFTLAIGVERLRAYSLSQQRILVDLLQARGIEALGAQSDRSAFVAVRRDDAVALAEGLDQRGIDVDARGEWLRLCPDVLTTQDELNQAADALEALTRR
jgi:kynureninase